jgi:dolichol-phosphate mannosyltransferase
VFQHIASRLNPRGFKILMELLAVAKGYSVTEVPYVFRARARGLSKLSGAVVGDFAFALIELATRDLISVQFMKYASVGLTGVAVQYGSFYGLWNQVLTNPEMATSLAIGTAAIGNYLLNNLWTFRDRRHMGAMAILRGLATFLMVSSVGAYIAQALTWYGTIHHGSPLWASMGVGIIVSTVWNYAINLNCTWGGHDRPA